ncbi:unnamed protein product, partial [Closterium sp. NIES-53]
ATCAVRTLCGRHAHSTSRHASGTAPTCHATAHASPVPATHLTILTLLTTGRRHLDSHTMCFASIHPPPLRAERERRRVRRKRSNMKRGVRSISTCRTGPLFRKEALLLDDYRHAVEHARACNALGTALPSHPVPLRNPLHTHPISPIPITHALTTTTTSIIPTTTAAAASTTATAAAAATITLPAGRDNRHLHLSLYEHKRHIHARQHWQVRRPPPRVLLVLLH